MKLRVIPNWRKWWRMSSVQFMAASMAFQAAWESVPADLKTFIPPKVALGISLALLACGIVGRMIQQPKTQVPPQ